MPDDKPGGPSSPFNLGTVRELVSLIALLGCGFMAWQRNTSNSDFTSSQVTQLRSDLKDQGAQMTQLQIKLATVEQQVANLVQTLQQEQRFRSATQK